MTDPKPAIKKQSPYVRAGRPAPTEVRVLTEEKAFEIDYADGQRFRFTAEFLRVQSPSAEVQGHGPSQRQVVPGKRDVGFVGAEPIGHYAIRLKFDDGHDSGIFSWDYFYEFGVRHDEVWRRYLEELELNGMTRDPAGYRH